MRKLLFLIVLVTFSLKGHSFFNYQGTQEASALRSLQREAQSEGLNSFKVLIWNVYKEGKRSFSEEERRILTQEKPHIALYQEAKNSPGQTCMSGSDCFFSEAIQVEEDFFGVKTSSTLPIKSARALHSDHLEPILETPKTSLITYIEINGREMAIINTHGINFVGLEAYRLQLEEIEQEVSIFDGPLVWGGDFNSWSKKRIKVLNEITDRLGLEEIIIKKKSLIKSFMGHKLDRVFSRDLKILKSEALKCSGSDHNPIVVEFSAF